MILIVRALYIVFIGYLFYKMIKNGGCCGVHPENKNTNFDKERIITENQKKKAIEIEQET